MHISEGVLTAPILVTGAVLSMGGVVLGLKKTSYEQVPHVALLASAFFVATLVHVPIGPSAAHLVLNGLCGLILGWGAFPAILVGLTLQALLFQYGGLTTLGVNTFTMAAPAVLMGWGCRSILTSPSSIVRQAGEFFVGAGAILLSGILVALCLVATGESFVAAAKLIVLAHIPVMIAEGLITVFIVEFIRRIRPEMLNLK
jgi:cobalt/nickel transport system permease protein